MIASISSFQWILLVEVGIIAAVTLLGAVHRP